MTRLNRPSRAGAPTHSVANPAQCVAPALCRGPSAHFLGIVLLIASVWFGWVYYQINAVARQDQAQTADAIAVFGAAEYLGRPSPVFHARLDHAVTLYERHVAPLIITLGGGGDRDSGNTEGGVGRDYLLANGIPYDRIVAETRSIDTEQQVQRLAAIAAADNLQHIVVVSDGTHLFRIRELCPRRRQFRRLHLAPPHPRPHQRARPDRTLRPPDAQLHRPTHAPAH